MGGRLTEWAYTLLRIVVGFLFFCHGAQKILGWFTEPGGHRMALTFPMLPWFAGWLELAGGALIMVGLLTHVVAFLLSGEMAVAYFMAHAPHGFIPLLNHGELAVLYCFIFLFIAAHGAGPFSLDATIGKRRRP
jgi:putative oxidoreductase